MARARRSERTESLERKRRTRRIAERFLGRYRALFGAETAKALGRGNVENMVGRLLARAPAPERLVRELLDLALEAAASRGPFVPADLETLSRALDTRRKDALAALVGWAFAADRRFAHPWFSNLSRPTTPALTNSVVLARFKVEMKGVGDLRPRTIASYLTSAEQFSRFLVRPVGSNSRALLDATPDDIRAFKVRMVSRKLAPASVNLRLAGVKALYRLLVREKLAGHEILEAFRVVPVPKHILTLLDAGEVERLLAAIDPSTPVGLRDETFFRLLFATGARVGELTHLTLADLDLARGRLVFVGRKNREDHIALVPPLVVRALKRYLAKARPALLAKSRPANHRLVFLSWRGGVFYRGNVSMRLALYAKAAKITKRVTSHTFRRSIATALADRGMPAEVIRVFLGHRKLSTTLGAYVAYSRETLRANLEKYHPWFGTARKPRKGGKKARTRKKRGRP